MELNAQKRLGRRKGKKGFTLIEALFALMIFTVALAGSMGLLNWMVGANGDSARVSQASSLAQSKIEELREGFYRSVSGGNDTVGMYTRTWTSTLGDGGKHVTVTVSWTGTHGGAQRSVSQKSYFYGQE